MRNKLIIFYFLFLLQFSTEAQYHENLIPYHKTTYDNTHKGGITLWGYADSTKKIIIPLQFKNASRFKNGTAIVKDRQLKKDLVALIDTLGNFLIPFGKYDYINFFNESGYANVVKDGKHGMIDRGFKEVIPLKYEGLGNFKDGIVPAKLNKKWGFIDSTQKVIIDFKYDQISQFQHGIAKVRLGNYLDPSEKTFFINRKGEEIFTTEQFKEMDYMFSDGLMMVEKREYTNDRVISKCGYIDTLLKTAIPLQYEEATRFVNGRARVKKDGKWGVIDTKGKMVVPFKYEYLSTFNDGLAAVKINGRFGFLNEKYKVVINSVYEDFQPFSEGMAAIQFNGKWGFINTKGEVIVPIIYEEVKDFCEGLAAVKKDLDQFSGDWGYVDKTGVLAIPIKFYSADDFKEGYAEVDFDSYVNKKGEIFAEY